MISYKPVKYDIFIIGHNGKGLSIILFGVGLFVLLSIGHLNMHSYTVNEHNNPCLE